MPLSSRASTRSNETLSLGVRPVILSLQNTLVETAQAQTRLAVLRQSFVTAGGRASASASQGSVARRSGSHWGYSPELLCLLDLPLVPTLAPIFGGPLGVAPGGRMSADPLYTLTLDTSFNAKQEGSP